MLPQDTAPTGDGPSAADLGPWAVLLPTLDPTTMGWRGREFHLLPQHVRHLFDSVGNGGTTVWLNGRVIGAWVQDAAGRVQPILLEPVSADEWRLIDAEATALSDWLHGQVITNVYKSALLKGETLPSCGTTPAPPRQSVGSARDHRHRPHLRRRRPHS